MLPLAFRLRRDIDYTHLWRRGHEASAGGLRVRWVHSSLERTRVGIVISKRVSKHATKRNRLRRVLREGIRPFLPRLRPHTDYLLVATPRLLGISSHDARALLERVGHRNRLFLDT